MATDSFRSVPLLAAAIGCMVLAMRVINNELNPVYTHLSHGFPTHLRIDALFLGVALAYRYHFHADKFRAFSRWRYALIGIGATLALFHLSLLQFGPSYSVTFGFTIEALGCAAVLVGVLLCKVPVNGLTSPLALLGTYSYSIYLWHMAIIYWVTPHLRTSVSWELRALLYFGGAFVIGITMAKVVELPTIRLRDRLFPTRSLTGDSLADRLTALRDTREPATVAARTRAYTRQINRPAMAPSTSSRSA
jgi:peptidoglycan/LPS O-acetylase OafA/YrhL